MEHPFESAEEIVDNISVGLYRASLDRSGEFLDVNSALVSLLDADSKSELEEHTIFDFYRNPTDRADFLDQLRAEGQMDKKEIAVESLTGREFSASVTATLHEDDDTESYYGIFQNVGTKQQLESRYKSAFDAIYDSVFVHTLSGQFVLVNETAIERLGYTEAEFLSMGHSEIHSTETDIQTETKIQQLSDEGQLTFESIHVAKDGTEIPVEIHARQIDFLGRPHIVSVARDISQRKQHERELESREEKYRTLFEDTRDALMLMDREEYRDCNEQTLKLFGVDSVEDFVGSSPWDFSPPTQPDGSDSKAAALERINEAFEEGEAFFEWTHQRADGTKFPAEVKLSRFEYEGTRVLQALVRDITERNEQKQQLAAERNRIQAITNAIPDVTIVYDRQGQYREVLTGQERLLVDDVSELEGSNAIDMLDPAVAETTIEAIEKSLDTGTIQTIEYALDLAGEQTWFEGRIAPMPGEGRDEVVQLARDITARKKQERELKAREEKYRNLFENTRDALMLLDRDGFFDCNQRALELFGVDSVDAFVTYSPWELSPPTQSDGSDSKDAALVHVETAFEEGEASFEWTHQRADGTEFPAEVKLSRFEHEGEPALHALVRDITERKEYQQQVERQRDDLNTLNQVLRHDIRNDLHLVTSYAELLAGECETIDDEIERDVHQYVETIQDRAAHSVELTTTAREMADTMLTDEEGLEAVNLRSVLENEVGEVQAAYPEAVVTTESVIPSLKVQADNMLGSVFQNLLKNGIRHNDSEVPQVKVSVTESETDIVVRVADNGPGIPDAQKETIFGKGEKGLESQGSGIGLYLVQTLMTKYEGSVWIEDNDPEGSVFAVELRKAS